MSVSDSLLSYQDCTQLLDAAMDDEEGVRIKVEDLDAAYVLRQRIHYCRKLHRRENSIIYEPGQPLYGKSAYDAITVRINNIDGDFYLYLQRTDSVRGEIEPLSKVDGN